jgi:uncharacterized protein (DUF2062 family)
MPKKLVSKIMPSAERLEHMRSWGFLGEKLFAHDLWHLNRKTVGYAFLNGIFWASMPMPFQMVGAAISALLVRCNVPISVGLCWLTNPITMPPYFAIAYTLGAWVLNSEPLSLPDTITQSWIQEQLSLIWLPLLTGSLLIGISAGLLGLIGLRLWWRWKVNHNWKTRRRSPRHPKKLSAGYDATQTADLSEPQHVDRESR